MIHGGDIRGFAKSIDCDSSEVIDLSSNINFVKPLVEIDLDSIDISNYPDYSPLIESLSRFYSVSTDKILLFGGANSAIYSLFKYLKPDSVSLYTPIYLEYIRYAKGAKIQKIDRFRDIDIEAEGDLIIFVNPSTPDGRFYDIEPFLERYHNRYILIDESFIEFSSKESAIKYIDRYPNLFILRSISKYFGGAGIRIGAVIGSNIDSFRDDLPLWRVSALDMRYLEKALEDSSFHIRSRVENEKSREILLRGLKEANIVKRVYPSVANFHLIELNITAQKLQERLKKDKILIRDCSNFDGLSEYFIRVALKSPKEMQIFIEAIKNV